VDPETGKVLSFFSVLSCFLLYSVCVFQPLRPLWNGSYAFDNTGTGWGATNLLSQAVLSHYNLTHEYGIGVLIHFDDVGETAELEFEVRSLFPSSSSFEIFYGLFFRMFR
jgi:hypothetical protein